MKFYHLRLFAVTLSILFSCLGKAQTGPPAVPTSTATNVAGFSFGLAAGYDLPLFNVPYEQLDYRGDRYLAASLDYQFIPLLGARLQYANIRTNPLSNIPATVFVGTTPTATSADYLRLNRHFAGIGPSFRTSFGASPFSLQIIPMLGRSWLSGGDARVNSSAGTQLVNTGFTDKNWAAKADLEFGWRVSPNFSLTAGVYYLRHFQVHGHSFLDLNPTGLMPISHGENVYDNTVNPYTVSANPPNVVVIDPENPNCLDLSSIGFNLGARFHFGGPRRAKVVETVCPTCCPNDGHGLVITVRDRPTQQVIPDADVALKDMNGQIVATGTTNSYGVVSFDDIPHNDYIVEGQVFGIATTVVTVADAEFLPNTIVRKEVLYEDLRFILKGVTRNKSTRLPEPDVLVRLTNDSQGAVVQDNSDANGKFGFRLDPNSSYTTVGSKRNRLSDIERASTVGLTRSTTLFVELELGVDDFNCGQGAVLDIKYDLDDDALTLSARFELDRLVNYLEANPNDRIELGSHTDSRGTNTYNQSLSDRRARSAVNYIISRGVRADRIVASGYGETRLLNGCADGVGCSEEQHRINRRTEATLICR